MKLLEMMKECPSITRGSKFEVTRQAGNKVVATVTDFSLRCTLTGEYETLVEVSMDDDTKATVPSARLWDGLREGWMVPLK